MPKSFTDCIAAGGKIRTKELGKGKYIYVCFPKGGGPSVAGEVKTKQKLPSRSSTRKQIKKEYGE